MRVFRTLMTAAVATASIAVAGFSGAASAQSNDVPVNGVLVSDVLAPNILAGKSQVRVQAISVGNRPVAVIVQRRDAVLFSDGRLTIRQNRVLYRTALPIRGPELDGEDLTRAVDYARASNTVRLALSQPIDKSGLQAPVIPARQNWNDRVFGLERQGFNGVDDRYNMIRPDTAAVRTAFRFNLNDVVGKLK